MRRRYLHALNNPLPFHKMCVVRMMIKYEKMHKLSKPPRAIQYRSTQFTLQFAKYILPLERAVYDLNLDRVGLRTFAKGRNNHERAVDLRAIYDDCPGWDIYLADHSHFDASVGVKHLQACHDLYKMVFNNDKWLGQLCRAQLKNRGWTRGGLKYTCVARRMSGDADTALGNSLINYMVLKYMFGEECVVYCDGDDSVVFAPKGSVPRLDGSGFTTVVNRVDGFENIEFCQCYPLLTEKGWIMARRALRAMTRMSVSCGKPMTGSYVKTIGLGETRAQPYVAGVYDLARYMSTFTGKFIESFLEYQTKVGAVDWDDAAPTTQSWAEATRQEDGCLIHFDNMTVVVNPALRHHDIAQQ